MILSIFSYACWPSVYLSKSLLFENVPCGFRRRRRKLHGNVLSLLARPGPFERLSLALKQIVVPVVPKSTNQRYLLVPCRISWRRYLKFVFPPLPSVPSFSTSSITTLICCLAPYIYLDVEVNRTCSRVQLCELKSHQLHLQARGPGGNFFPVSQFSLLQSICAP